MNLRASFWAFREAAAGGVCNVAETIVLHGNAGNKT
jgi:hypothetical protein